LEIRCGINAKDTDMIEIYPIETHKLLKKSSIIPDYYREFACKGAKCRNTCCSGWAVTISRQQYFDLVGIGCHKKLRAQLDRTFRLIDYPSIERYAEIMHDHQGRCPLHRADGYCMLHKDLGETALPSVCRSYPRGLHTDYALESSCSNSCEQTLELLIGNDDLVKFTTQDLSVDPPVTSQIVSQEDMSFYMQVRNGIFTILADRKYPLPSRILGVGKYLLALDLDRNADLASIDLGLLGHQSSIPQAIELMIRISSNLKELYPRLAIYCDEFANYYQDDDRPKRYEAALNHFNQILSNQEIMFEKILINHLFFSQFPFQDRSRRFGDHFRSLCGTYLFIRHLSITSMLNHQNVDDFIDIMANMFRIISHTKFMNNVAIFLKNENVDELEMLAALIQV
jgi:hypothetical protein